MINLEEIKKKLEVVKKARKEREPIVKLNSKALDLFETLCSFDKGKPSYAVAKSLSEKLAIECMTELDLYFYNMKFADEKQKKVWNELSDYLRKIYTSSK
ncbi:MAG: hypothetical protein SCARUB_00761 [Candidatus Scalindua rubra]|uniref:Uncharacterized protein n=1 Tax=Candidatus Scalindua rubra TaxID=1872076 RepID=A0A1E3XEQ5_9BACT|nr:MAG: hypothetical protein SCARUB_00761 [Candidatus Scalindua rubra]